MEDAKVAGSALINYFQAMQLKQLFCLLMLASPLLGQDLKPESSDIRIDPAWLQSYPTMGVLSSSLAADPQGNTYSGGTFQTALMVGDTNYQVGDIGLRESFPNIPFVQKHSSSGQHLWTVFAEGQGRLNDIVVSDDGSVFFTGEFWRGILVVLSSNGERDTIITPPKAYRGLYIVKLNTDGVFQNATFFNKLSHANGAAIALDSKGGLIVAGNYMYREEIQLKRNWLLMRYHPNLELDWLRAGDSTGRSALLGLSLDGRDNIYVCGWYASALSMGNEELKLNHDTQKALIAKWEGTGNLTWLQSALTEPEESSSQVVVNDILVDYWHRVYISGAQFQRLFLAELDRDGELDWLKRVDGRSSYCFGLAWGKHGRILVYGHGYGSSFWRDSEPQISYIANGSTDFFIVEATRSGRVKDLIVGGGGGTDYLTDLVYHKGEVLAIGHDLGGLPIRFKEKELPKGRPRVWLAGWKWD